MLLLVMFVFISSIAQFFSIDFSLFIRCTSKTFQKSQSNKENNKNEIKYHHHKLYTTTKCDRTRSNRITTVTNQLFLITNNFGYLYCNRTLQSKKKKNHLLNIYFHVLSCRFLRYEYFKTFQAD